MPEADQSAVEPFTDGPTAAIALAPEDYPWRKNYLDAVRRGGGTVVPVADATGLIWLAKGEASVTDHLHPGIRWVQLRSAGVEHWINTGQIDSTRTFTSARGIYNGAVAEHIVALVLAASRNLAACARATEWNADLGGRMLRGATVGILGAGGVGQEAMKYLNPLGVRVIAISRTGRHITGAALSLAADQFHSVLGEIDYLVVSAPSTPDTHAFIGATELDTMKDDAWIINVARGSLIDTDALVAALTARTIGGAALDVTDPEPLPEHHPLWTLPNVLVTPHVANPKPAQHRQLQDRVTENVRRFVHGEELLGIVDLTRGY